MATVPTTTGSWRRALTVLLVDDQPIIGESLRLTLEPERDIAFHFCQDPLLAVETAALLGPTVILQDLVMPGIDGLDLVRIFREDERTKEIPLVVLSTKEDPEVKAEAFRRGANDYLVKLPSAIELVARIRYHSEAYRNAVKSRVAYEALLESREELRDRNEEILAQRDALARQAEELELRNRFIKKTFGRYLSDEVVKSLLESPEGLKLGGESRVVTILMSDLRGFTAAAERLTPEQVVTVLNNYLGRMADVITELRGTIDEFIGDAVLALFGAPDSSPDDAERAVACALAMQRAMLDVNERNASVGLPALEMGIALHTGEVVVGNIGSTTRAKYGVVGSNVNLTARIESCTVGGQVLVSEACREAAGPHLTLGERITVGAKGFREPIVAYDLLGIAGRWALTRPRLDEERIVELVEPVAVRFTPLEDKRVGSERREGTLRRLSARRAEIETVYRVRAFSNVLIRLTGPDGAEIVDDLYGKVVRSSLDDAEGFSVRFTSVPPALVERIRVLVESALQG